MGTAYDLTRNYIERCVLQVANVGPQALEGAQLLKLIQLLAQHDKQHTN